MALRIIVSDGQSFVWSHTEKKPKFPDKRPDDWHITFLQADNADLAFIRMVFDNIPFCEVNQVVTWRGIFAQFIYDNL